MSASDLCVCGHARGMHDGGCMATTVIDDGTRGGHSRCCKCPRFVLPSDTGAVVGVAADGTVFHSQFSQQQPAPLPHDASKPAVWALVMVDMHERDIVGRKRYGTPLQPHNGRDALTDAYQEALDLAVYLRQALYERDGR